MAVKGGAIWLIVGESGRGKTTFCRQIVSVARQKGSEVRGLLCPARFENGVKVGFDVLDLQRGEQRHLGWHRDFTPQPSWAAPPVAIGEWLLDSQALQWGNQVLRRATPCDLLVIDELGPLEFFAQTGWQAAFEILDRRAFRLALVVVRQTLRPLAQQRWQIDGETHLTACSQAVVENEIEKLGRRFGLP
ncbi:MAG: hypothetical protein DDG59_03855 [Anaerolineae bacterium]|jgi:nucleoside-triphosphatase THEP1|nr:MAG: hypothetical protein DDG59_03855 [Anaerolineae bacterium]